MLSAPRAFVFGLLCGLAVACGSFVPSFPRDGGVIAGGAAGGASPPFDAGVSDGGLSWRAACPVLNARRCEALKRCGLIEDDTEAYRECVAWLTATWCGPSKWTPRVEVGTLRYDALRAETCATEWTSRTCADVLTEPTSCTRFLSPAAPLRGACYDGYDECADGVCRGAACPRTCLQRGVVDEVCQADDDCQSTLYCRPSLTTGPSQCTAYAREGSLCGPTQWCSQGLHCVMSLCRPLPAAESACVQGRCDDSSFCVAVDGGTCEARRDAGALCSDDAQCGAGLLCDSATKACVPAELSSIGGACTFRQRCPGASTCLVDEQLDVGVCGPPRREGEACVRPTDCQAHLTCAEADGGRHCVTRLQDGRSCTTSRDCRVLSTCFQGLCRELPTLGKTCTETGACLWGACAESPDAGSRCIEVQGPGQPCRAGSDCASGRCERGLCTAACLP